MFLDSLLNKAVVPGQRLTHALTEGFPKFGGALDVGKQQGYDSLRHRSDFTELSQDKLIDLPRLGLPPGLLFGENYLPVTADVQYSFAGRYQNQFFDGMS